MSRKSKEEIYKLFYKKGYLYKVKIFYKSGRIKYANLFDRKKYEMGTEIGSIIGYRRMNVIERFIFRNCL